MRIRIDSDCPFMLVDAECSECRHTKEGILGAYFPGMSEETCRETALKSAKSVKLDDFCPNCGEDMRGGSE